MAAGRGDGGVAAAGVVSIHAIGGMAGIGKTTLAVHAAHQLAPRFPDGQIFLPLHGHTPGQRPVDPADALASLLLTAGVAAAQIPPGLEPRMAVWRDRLAGKQMLLLLDDAAEQRAGPAVAAWHRREPGAGHQPPAPDRAGGRAGDQPRYAAARGGRRAAGPARGQAWADPGDAAVAEITRLCGYLPLAIGMLARQLHHHPAWTAAELAAELAARGTGWS